MLFTTITTLFLSSVAFAAPTALDARAENCAPTSYTISDFFLSTSSSHAVVSFHFQSTFADTTGIDDSVTNGSTCYAEGASIPNSNECSAPRRKLLFDLRGPQNTARYQITHTWVCNGKTWMSGNDVTVGPLNCPDSNCTAGPQTFAPQNVRQICGSPNC
ncbi:hypothetical protein CC86DRAFT_54283 [Ophiobolus disseminans]|uniref:Hypersensitive response inducing protein 1 n=1 Tax=Ophiobolus disseminans TaxID=1469910 RepID=A0A6A6ZU13_9PLEO|nr:hypothetical protein CC86DRAFT_54283 [Ophiobolus disseminans]